MRRPLVGPVLVLLALLVLAPAAVAEGRDAGSAPSLPGTHTRPLLGTKSESSNWSGYDVSGGAYTTVTATWVQPRVKGSGGRFSATAFWVGLDGDGSDTVEQIGTEAYSEGVVAYAAWYEMYPDYPVALGMSIHPGDELTATVTWIRPSIFRLRLDDTTTGDAYSTDQVVAIPPALASAEIIAEAPSTGSGDVVRIADYTLSGFTGCSVDGKPLGDYDWTSIDMVDQREDRLSVALPLDVTGTAFGVTTDVTAPVTTAGGAGGWSNEPVTVRFRASDAGSGVAYTEYSTDAGATWTKGTSLTVAAPADHTGDGDHKVLYRSVDRAANVEKARTCRVGIDTQRPVLQTGGPVAVRRGDQASLRYTVHDAGGSPTATVGVAVKDRRGKVVLRATLPRRRTGRSLGYRFRCDLQRGTYTYSISATDAAGNRQAFVASSRLVVR
jgi:hypothetical protein